jgi:DNA repair photolyase
VAERLDRELSRRKWRHARINLSGVTDAYQPAEAEMKLMPEIWKVLIRHRNPVVITTKSALILRDLDLIAALARVTSVYVGASITILDETLRKSLEPGAAPAMERFRVMKECREAGCTAQVMLTPVLPMINDTLENLEGIYIGAKENGVTGLSAWPLNLRGSTKQKFFNFLDAEFPHLLPHYRRLYAGPGADPGYERKITHLKEELRRKYGIPGLSVPSAGTAGEVMQLSLF